MHIAHIITYKYNISFKTTKYIYSRCFYIELYYQPRFYLQIKQNIALIFDGSLLRSVLTRATDEPENVTDAETHESALSHGQNNEKNTR